MMNQQNRFELLVGPAGKYYYFADEIAGRIRRQARQSASDGSRFNYDFLYFLPVKRGVRYFTEQLIRRSPGTVLADPPVNTFYQFMIELYKSFPDARKVVSPSMRLFLVEEVLQNHLGELRFFSASSAGRRGLIRKVDTMLEEMREYGYSADELLHNLDPSSDEDDDFDVRLHDFSVLIRGFEAVLGTRLIDEAAAINAVCQRLQNEPGFWQSTFPHIEVIYLNGYGLFTRPMFRFFEAVRNECSLRIKLDYLPDHSQLFRHVDPAFEAFKRLNPTIIVSEPAEKWEAALFSRAEKVNEALPYQGEILVQAAATRHEEVAFIASYIRRLHQYKGVALDRIGLTFPNFEKYAPLIHEVFPQYGIPYNISAGYQLSQSPLIRSFLLMLEVVLNGYEWHKVFQLLSSPFFRGTGGQPLDLRWFSEVLANRRVQNLKGEYWLQVLTEFAASQQEQINRQADSPDRAAILQKRVDYLRDVVLNDVRELLRQLFRLEKKQSAAEFREVYLELLKTFGFLDWYQNDNRELGPRDKEKEYRAFNRFIKLLDQFSWIVTNRHDQTRLTLREFYQYLGLLISDATYNLREWSAFGVQIMPRLEVESTEPEVLIFGGMIEGEFPRPYSQDVFFNDDRRAQLGLIATEDLLAQDRYLLYQVLRSPAGRLVFTYPAFEKESARVPSNFLNTIEELVAVRWRTQFPSSRFLRNRKQIIYDLAARIPAGIGQMETDLLANYLRVQQDRQFTRAVLGFWLERVRSNYRKRSAAGFSEYEGILSSSPVVLERLARRFADRAFSITRLETFAFCPIRFFFKYILNLDEPEQPEHGLTPLERGNLVHNVLYRFYSEVREAGHHHHPWTERERLLDIAAEEFARFHFEGILYELEQERYFGTERRKGLWDMFLQVDREHIEKLDFYPSYFEVGFGATGDSDEKDRQASVDEAIVLRLGEEALKLTGKIDRVDLNDAGQAIVIDYKTGSNLSDVRKIYAGISLQLPVYALVISELLQRVEQGRPVLPVMGSIFQVKDVADCTRIGVMVDAEALSGRVSKSAKGALPGRIDPDSDEQLTFEALLERSRAYLFKYVESIQGGEFRHTRYPLDNACASYCEFKRMCRKDVKKLLERGEKP